MDSIKKTIIFHKGHSKSYCDSCDIAFWRQYKKSRLQKHLYNKVECGHHHKMKKHFKRKAKRILQRELKKEIDNA